MWFTDRRRIHDSTRIGTAHPLHLEWKLHRSACSLYNGVMALVREGLTKEGEPRYTGNAALPFAYRRCVRNCW